MTVAVCSIAAMPPISEQARAGLDRALGAKGVYVSEESAYTFTFPRADVSLRVGGQRLSPAQSPKSWATFAPSMHREGMVNGELIVLDDEVNPVLTVALRSGLEVTGLGATLLSEQPRLLTLNVTGEGTYQTLGAAMRKTLDEVRRVTSENPQPPDRQRRSITRSTLRHSTPFCRCAARRQTGFIEPRLGEWYWSMALRLDARWG